VRGLRALCAGAAAALVAAATAGAARQSTVVAKQATAKIGRRRCAVGAGTALAALIRSRVAPLALKDFGSCSSKPADAGQLFVRAIGSDRNAGVNGWVYKVGTRSASAGAGDASGPFGHGRLKAGAMVTWFFCKMTSHGCQPTLTVAAKALGGGSVRLSVRACDDNAHCGPAAGATVHAGSVTGTTAADGTATLMPPPGHVAVFAEKAGMVRSFEETLNVP
jgi:hypothetical protein